MERFNMFVVHSWAESDAYARMTELLADRTVGLADYSVPPWKAVPGPDDVVVESITSRLSFASAVVVLNTQGLHKREMSNLEIRHAISLDKRIIVLQPHNNFYQPIPQALHGHVYRVSPWRSDVLWRAIQGEYAADGRVFDIAEVAERRQLVQLLSGAVGAISVALLIRTIEAWSALNVELAGQGVRLQWRTADTGEVAAYALGAAVIVGGIVGLATGDWKSAAWAAAGGGIAGAALGAHRVYQASLSGAGGVAVLAVDQISPG